MTDLCFLRYTIIWRMIYYDVFTKVTGKLKER